MGNRIKKEYLILNGRSILSMAITPFVETGLFSNFVVTVPPGGEEAARRSLVGTGFEEMIIFQEGGETRQHSVFKGLLVLESRKPEYVLIHDGARPWVTRELIVEVLKKSEEYNACIPVVPPLDAIKTVDESGFIVSHLDRKNIRCAQTPQGFRYRDILEAHRKASTDGKEYPDDSEVYCTYCGRVAAISGDPANRKITFVFDLGGAR